MLSRTNQNIIANWWWTVDRLTVGLVIVLMSLGVMLSFAASPPVAEKLGADAFHFVEKHIIFYFVSIVAMLATSLLTPRQVRRVALLILIGSLILMVGVLIFGEEVKGAKRWIRIVGFSLQPSEFIKPAYAVLAAWLFSINLQNRDIPGDIISFVLLVIIVSLLILQPDVGQSILLVGLWSTFFFTAGVSWVWIGSLSVLSILGLVMAYLTIDHVRSRIDRFINPETGDTFQIDKAIEAIKEGGWFGRGPGEGIVKRVLPDSHTDFVFSVAAEEFGLLFCMLLTALFAYIVLRNLRRSSHLQDKFCRMAGVGLITLFGAQAAINIAVNLQLAPTKGMTLPFISYGGSSMLSMAIGFGFLLALTRKWPESLTNLSAPEE